MARRRKKKEEGGFGCLVLIAIVALFVFSDEIGGIWVAIGIGLGVLVLFAVIVVALEGPSNCQICGNQLTPSPEILRLNSPLPVDRGGEGFNSVTDGLPNFRGRGQGRPGIRT